MSNTEIAHRLFYRKERCAVMYHRQSRWLERSEPLKAVENLEPPEGGY
jgi:hypothetical protein